jgi:hypothetical protein
MFADLTRLISRRPPADYEGRFVRRVSVRGRSPRNTRVERFIVAGWIVIAAKSAAVLWIFDRYRVPVNPLWVIAPTVVFAGLCTLVYLLRD